VRPARAVLASEALGMFGGERATRGAGAGRGGGRRESRERMREERMVVDGLEG